MRIIIATIRKWNLENSKNFILEHPEHDVQLITERSCFIKETVEAFSPDYIFFTHWCWMIPEWAYGQYRCILFHPSDLPRGRGGSPIQNQIKDGYTRTMISAIAVEKEVDSGAVYLKRELSLMGTAEEIFIRESKIIFEDMIPAIMESGVVPKAQEGRSSVYKRRKPEQSVLPAETDLIGLFDHIRMLDADGYPAAFLKWGGYEFQFTRPKLCVGEIICDVKIKIDDSAGENSK